MGRHTGERESRVCEKRDAWACLLYTSGGLQPAIRTGTVFRVLLHLAVLLPSVNDHCSTVSYTHLDVYKRQTIYGMTIKQMQVTLRVNQAKRMPVSYTHLDVYKRQEVTRAKQIRLFPSFVHFSFMFASPHYRIFYLTVKSSGYIPKVCLLYTSRCV